MLSDAQVREYLDRIHYDGPMNPTLEALHAIHVQHLCAVPFENLDIHLKRPILLSAHSFFEKIVRQNRGGFCYELNGLFFELLTTMGFNVKMLSAQVARPDGTFGREFDHMALVVELEEPWIADVGFGESFLEPLRLNDELSQLQKKGRFRITRHPDGARLYQSEMDGRWVDQYKFTLQQHPLEDFSEMCVYQQTSPESHFTRNVICSVATLDGRITLTNKKLMVTSDGVKTEHELTGKTEFDALLSEEFGITIR